MTQGINSAVLSAEQRQALERLLQEEGIDLSVGKGIPRRLNDDQLPLSFAQQRLWFLDQLESGSSAYNMVRVLRFNGELDQAAIESALTELVRRHESLRTTFTASDGQPRQVITPPPDRFQLSLTDLSSEPEAEREASLQQLLHAEVECPFDLSSGPLFRAGLLRLGEHEHVFYLSMHHIVSDGWSMSLLFREFSALYSAALHQQQSPLPELPIQYADYALWQRDSFSGELLAQQLDYWRRQLQGAPAVLELPADYARPAQQSYHGHTHRLALDQALVTRLKQFSQQSGCTLFMTLLAAFKVLMYRYTGQPDIVVGTPVVGRNRGELEGLIGFFVNTLVLRTELSDNPSFKELLARVREVCLGAYAHQDLPFEKLVEELQPERSLSHMPLCQVAISMQNMQAAELKLEGLKEARVDVVKETAKFDLTLSLWEETGLMGTIQYNSDLFEPSTIQSMADHFQTLMDSAITRPEQRISDLKMLTPAEERQLLRDWNDTQLDRSPTECIYELFEKQVAKTPNAVGLISETQSLTYDELNKRANQIANYLRSLGVGPEHLVGVCVERSVDLVAALMGVMKSGAAYVPIDPAYPRARLAFMLEDADIKVLITQESLLEFSQELPVTRVSLDGDRDKIAAASDKNPANLTVPDNLAYIIYTSGSTGRPKGIGITHRSAATLLAWARDFYTPEEMQGVSAATSICFDISTFEMFAPLTQGTKCILAENSLALPSLRAANQITLLEAVPSAVAELVRMNGIPSSVRMVNLPGEPLSGSLVEQIFRQQTVERAVNLYGPSEDTTFSTYALLTRNDQLPPPIGRPVSNTQIYILDKNFQLVPARVPGELYIGGDGVSRGYLNRPAQTAERYLPNPFGPPGSRMYKTGDLARYRLDGNLEYLGRIDHQVKIRGFRIELGEIEAALDEHQNIRESIVMARDDANGAKQLVAYVVMTPETFSVGELRTYIKDRLPEYMIPSVFVRLDCLPTLPNGKIDRIGLPDPGVAGVASEDSYKAPQTPIEEVLAGMWSSLLRVERVGINDNFFALGGHSLLAVQLISRIRDLLLVELPLLTLFEAPTVGLLAAAVTAHETQPGRTEKIARILLRVQQSE